ncbi:MAG TPA: calcium/proton exchanger [Gaiellales bacterium]|nr:calcium/proton exchanger [Gaiellales bacterium]
MSRAERLAFAVVFALSVAAVGLRAAGARGAIVFVVAAVALAGLAWLLGEATDQAGDTAGPRASALINASFGNLPEIVIVVLAIDAGLSDIARASIIGSVIGNILLILGISLLAGGWRHGIQTFNERVAATNSSMLILGLVGLGLPTLFAALHSGGDEARVLSDWTAGALLFSYVAYLFFSFNTPGLQFKDEPRPPRWSGREAVAALVVTALATGIVSEVLVHSIESAIRSLGVPRAFVGLVVVPFVGNVAEHFSAVRLAARNRVDFAMGIAYGSGIQIALGASGIAVFASIALGNELTLVFDPLQLAALGAAAVGSTLVARGGETNWLEGLQLLAVYLIVAVAVWLR